jgi:hypothetical protein
MRPSRSRSAIERPMGELELTGVDWRSGANLGHKGKQMRTIGE